MVKFGFWQLILPSLQLFESIILFFFDEKERVQLRRKNYLAQSHELWDENQLT